jgi:hypothetical protein
MAMFPQRKEFKSAGAILAVSIVLRVFLKSTHIKHLKINALRTH